MNDRDIRRHDRGTRVQTYGVENTADFPAGGKAKTHFANIDGFIKQLDDAKAGQSPNRVSKETLLDALGIDLQNIARTARQIEAKENGFAAPYRLPDNTSESAVTTHTDAVLLRLEDQPADTAALKPKQPAAYKDESRRFIFHVWKKGATSPVLQHSFRIRLLPEQESYGVNLVTGQKAPPNDSADLIIRIPLVEDPAGAARGDRWFIFEVPQGGILETSDVYPFAAPSGGYQPQWKQRHEIGKAGSESWRKNFYLSGRGGRIHAGLAVAWGIGSTTFEVSAVVNPTGTTQVESDASRRITEPEEIRQLDESLRSK